MALLIVLRQLGFSLYHLAVILAILLILIIIAHYTISLFMSKMNADSSPNNLDTLQLTEKMTETSVVEVTSIPLSLYIHIPWCVKKCPYCDFNSHELPINSQLSMYDDYVDALLLDANMQQTLAQGRKISSIFIGGGTPSLLPIAQYQRLFSGLRSCF